MIEILYCPTWDGYDRRAASLAAELERAGIAAEVTPGAKGQFDVVADGDVVFSKWAEHRFPEPAEVVTALRDRTGWELAE